MPRVPLLLAMITLGAVLAGVTFRMSVIPAEQARTVTLNNDKSDTAPVTRETSPNDKQAALALGQGVEELLQAVESEDPSRVPELRDEFLREVPIYERHILPALKERALSTLLVRMEEQDYKAWSRTAQERKSNGSNYVEQIFQVNSDLGQYLEEAGRILSELYQASLRGEGYEPLKNRGANQVRRQILLDPIFISILETERGRRVAEYFRKHPEEVATNFALLGSLKPKYCSANVMSEIAHLLARVRKEGTPDFRRSIVEDQEKNDFLGGFVHLDKRIGRQLAELFSVAALDALESRDLVSARRHLSYSLALKTGLESQRMLTQFMERYGLGTPEELLSERLRAEAAKEIPTPTHQITVYTEGDDEESSWSIPWKLVGAVALLAFLGGAGFAFWGRREEAVALPEENSTFNEWETGDIDLGLPSQVETEELFAPGERFEEGEPDRKIVNFPR